MDQSWLEINGQKFEPYFQKYRDLDSDTIVAGELLTRRIDGTSAFDEIRKFTIEDHFRLVEWLVNSARILANNHGFHCSINVDNKLVMDTASRNRLLQITDNAEFPLIVEFTETHAMPAVDETNKLFRSLRAQGHTCALDDFGTGLNGMTLLTDCDFDTVKVDRSLTLDIQNRPEKLQVVMLLRQMISALGKKHVVEGIDDGEIYSLLVDSGYRVFQGYLFDYPKSFQELNQIQIEGEGK